MPLCTRLSNHLREIKPTINELNKHANATDALIIPSKSKSLSTYDWVSGLYSESLETSPSPETDPE